MAFYVQYPGLYHLLYILIANDFVFHDENVVINFFHAQIVTYYYSNVF